MIPVIDLSVLNRHLIVPHFKMETNRSIRGSIRLGMWTTSLDLTDACFHIPISPKFCKFLRFVWEDRVYAFKAMHFGLSTTPLVFTRVFQAIVAHLHSQSILIHSYLDDSLLKNMSQFLLRDHTHFVIGLLLKLGFLISWKKSELVPSQDFIFVGEHYRTEPGTSFSPRGKNCNSTISGEQIFSNIVSTSSSIFTEDLCVLLGRHPILLGRRLYKECGIWGSRGTPVTRLDLCNHH
jgi:hypothetical protein